jgi:hypothetical protein
MGIPSRSVNFQCQNREARTSYIDNVVEEADNLKLSRNEEVIEVTLGTGVNFLVEKSPYGYLGKFGATGSRASIGIERKEPSGFQDDNELGEGLMKV